MRLRVFLLILIGVVIIGAGVLVVVLGFSGSGPLAGLLSSDDGPAPITAVDNTVATNDGNAADGAAADNGGGDAAVQEPDPEPDLRFVSVVVAEVDIPAGSVLKAELLSTELRPETNVAVRAGYVFSDPAELEGRIVGTAINRGQEVLEAMLALNPTDLTGIGTDLALYVERGEVAVAFPIDRYSGIAYAIRPGDRIDVMMTAQFVEVDEEFQSILPNIVQEVNQDALANGESFLFDPVPFGRLELIPLLNQVAVIGPGSPVRVLRPVTQLTVQQAEVLWVGTWRDGEGSELVSAERIRYEAQPDMVILGVTLQDAMFMKWALEVGLDIDLALRSQGDETVFITTSVSLPQIVEQTGVTVPDQSNLRLQPSIFSDQIEVPSLPAEPPAGEAGASGGQ